MLHKQHGKEKLMVSDYTRYHRESTLLMTSSLVNSKDGAVFAMLFIFKTARKAGGLQILRCHGFTVVNHRFTRDD
jgi:hypothetical protein